MSKDSIEHPFEKLNRKDGKPFDDFIVNNWYIARKYVKSKLKDVIIGPTSKEILKVVIEIDDDNKNLMLSVVRQVALIAHYPNYVEYDKFEHTRPETHSVIKVVSKDQDIVNLLKREEYLNNLLVYCQYKRNGVEQNKLNSLMPIDIDIDIVDIYDEHDKDKVILMTPSDIQSFLSLNKDINKKGIDTKRAVLSGRVYDIGVEIDNLPYEDIHDAKRYGRALTIFKYNILSREVESLVDAKWDDDQVKVKNSLSNIFCSDRFDSLMAGMDMAYHQMRVDFCKKCSQNKNNKCKKKENDKKQDNCTKKKITKESCWEKYEYELALSEHARWIVEKLILGFRPMNTAEQERYEHYFGKRRKEYGNLLKGDSANLINYFPDDYSDKNIDPTHVNLCSFKELRRIDPDNMKYDSFLMLAIPMILEIDSPRR